MRDSAGYLTFTSDPRHYDTDGDGLTDGEEMGEPFAFGELPEIFGIDLSHSATARSTRSSPTPATPTPTATA